MVRITNSRATQAPAGGPSSEWRVLTFLFVDVLWADAEGCAKVLRHHQPHARCEAPLGLVPKDVEEPPVHRQENVEAAVLGRPEMEGVANVGVTYRIP